MSDYRDDEFQEIPRLGSLLRHYRKRAELSQRALAVEAEVDQSNVSLIEKGATLNPWNSTLEALAVALARRIPNTSARYIADQLIASKRAEPPAPMAVDPRAVKISDRVATFSPRAQSILYYLIDQLVDGVEELDNGALGGNFPAVGKKRRKR